MRLLVLLVLLVPVAGLSWLLEREPEVAVRTLARTETEPRPPASLAPRRCVRTAAVAVRPRGVSVSGHVIGAGGRPVVGASVRSLDEEDRVWAVAATDGRGAFHLVGAWGDGTIVVDAGTRGRARTWLDDEDRRDLRIGLVAGATLQGRVLAPDGTTPVPHATLHVEEDLFGCVEARAGADGRFTISPVPRARPFELLVDGGAQGRASLNQVRWGERTLDVVLRRTRAVRGRVVEERPDGVEIGVPGVKVWAFERTHRGPRGNAAVTDEEGRFACYVFGFEGSFVTGSTEWYQAGKPADFPASGDAMVAVRRRATLVGRCVLEDGSPVESAEVWSECCRFDGTVYSDASGRFEIPLVGVRSTRGVRVTARRGGLIGRCRVTKVPEPGDEHRVVLERTASVWGRVLDEVGVPCTGVWITVRYTPGPVGDPDATELECELADADGRFRVLELAVGPCSVEVEAPGCTTRTIASFATLRGTSLGEIRLTPLRTRVGRLVDPSGRPIADGTWEAEDVLWRAVPAQADGIFRVALPSEEESTLRVAAPGFVAREIDVRDLPAEDPWTVVLQRCPTLEGRVLTPDGRPLTACTVQARGVEHDGEGWTCVDTDGRFTLELTSSGPYELEVDAGRYALDEPVLVQSDTSGLTLRPAEKPRLAGRVVGPGGAGLVHVGVVARDPDSRRSKEWWALTDEVGRFALSGLEGASFTLSVEGLPEGVSALDSGEVYPDEGEVVLEAKRTLSIDGRLLGLGTARERGILVRVRPIEWRDCDRTFPADRYGDFRIDGLYPGLYELSAEFGTPRCARTVTEKIRVRAGDRDVVLLLRPGEGR